MVAFSSSSSALRYPWGYLGGRHVEYTTAANGPPRVCVPLPTTRSAEAPFLAHRCRRSRTCSCRQPHRSLYWGGTTGWRRPPRQSGASALRREETGTMAAGQARRASRRGRGPLAALPARAAPAVLLARRRTLPGG